MYGPSRGFNERDTYNLHTVWRVMANGEMPEDGRCVSKAHAIEMAAAIRRRMARENSGSAQR